MIFLQSATHFSSFTLTADSRDNFFAGSLIAYGLGNAPIGVLWRFISRSCAIGYGFPRRSGGLRRGRRRVWLAAIYPPRSASGRRFLRRRAVHKRWRWYRSA